MSLSHAMNRQTKIHFNQRWFLTDNQDSSDEYLPHVYNVQIIVGSFQKTALSSINNNNNNNSSNDGNSSRIRKCFSICVGRQNTAPMHAITGLNFVCQFSLCVFFFKCVMSKKSHFVPMPYLCDTHQLKYPIFFLIF